MLIKTGVTQISYYTERNFAEISKTLARHRFESNVVLNYQNRTGISKYQYHSIVWISYIFILMIRQNYF